jgi:soluble lytic murein transglycosylase-like protein
MSKFYLYLGCLLLLIFPSVGQTCTLTEEASYPPASVVQNEKPVPLTPQQKIREYIQKYYSKISPEDAETIAQNITRYSQKQGLKPELVAALIARESSFNKFAVSRTGAKGLGQIKDFHFEKYNIQNPFAIEDNIRGMTALLADIKSNWQGHQKETDMVLASYFIGLGATKRSQGILPEKTQHYIEDIKNIAGQIESI